MLANLSTLHTLCFFVPPPPLVAAFQYASLFFIVGVGADSDDENELGVLEFIHCLVETLDKVRLQPFLSKARPAGDEHVQSVTRYVGFQLCIP